MDIGINSFNGKITILKALAILLVVSGHLEFSLIPMFPPYSFLAIKGIDFSIKNNADIYWFYFPLKTTYFYFVFGIITTTYMGEFFKFIKKKFIGNNHEI